MSSEQLSARSSRNDEALPLTLNFRSEASSKEASKRLSEPLILTPRLLGPRCASSTRPWQRDPTQLKSCDVTRSGNTALPFAVRQFRIWPWELVEILYHHLQILVSYVNAGAAIPHRWES